MSVKIRSFVRVSEGSFLDIGEMAQFAGDCTYVHGAISLVVDGVELFGLDLWDDVNWLWPFVIQALDECRQKGSGKRGFPDQPISIVAQRAWPGHTLLKVTDGATIHRSAVAADDELFGAVAHAGLTFFAELSRLCPSAVRGSEERRTLEAWLSSGI